MMQRRKCRECTVDFVALRKTAAFCSVACRMKSHRRWKAFRESPLGEKALRGVTLLQARRDSVTPAGDPSPSRKPNTYRCLRCRTEHTGDECKRCGCHSGEIVVMKGKGATHE